MLNILDMFETNFQTTLSMSRKKAVISTKSNLCFVESFDTLSVLPEPAYTYSKLTKETLQQGVKYVQS